MGEATERIDFSYCGEKIADENIINARLGVGRDPMFSSARYFYGER